MGEEFVEPRVFHNRFAGAAGPPGPEPAQDRCRCVGYSQATRPGTVTFHGDRQDTQSAAWAHLLALIEEAAADGRTVFKPLVEMTAAERRHIITLPATIATLTEVRHLVLYGSNLVRIPPEIGAMTSLEVFEPYTSHRLHWFPYELTRCARLRDSTVSTRSLYGNFKFRPPFPRLRPVTASDEADFAALDPARSGADQVGSCSVCGASLVREVRQIWISLPVGTDVLPLLVNACSADCVAALPPPPPNYVPTPHTGGPEVAQPGAED